MTRPNGLKLNTIHSTAIAANTQHRDLPCQLNISTVNAANTFKEFARGQAYRFSISGYSWESSRFFVFHLQHEMKKSVIMRALKRWPNVGGLKKLNTSLAVAANPINEFACGVEIQKLNTFDRFAANFVTDVRRFVFSGLEAN